MKTLLWCIMLALFAGITTYAEPEINEIIRLGRGEARSISWHPDGHLLAIGGSAGIWLFDENYQQLNHYPSSSIRRVEFSPNGHTLLVVDNMGDTTLWDFDSEGTVIKRSNLSIVNGYTARWSPDSQFLSTAQGTLQEDEIQAVQLEIWDTVTDESVWQASASNNFVDMVWSSDGQYLASAESDGAIKLIDASAGAILETARIPNDIFQEKLFEVMSIAFQADGKGLWLVFIGSQSLWTFDFDTQALIESEINIPFVHYWLWDLTTYPDSDLFTVESSGGGGAHNGMYIIGEGVEAKSIHFDDHLVDYDHVPNSDRFTVLTGNGIIREVNAHDDTVTEHQLFLDSGQVSWSPDSQWLLDTTGYNPNTFNYPVIAWNIPDATLESYQPSRLMYPYLSAKWSRWLRDSEHVMIFSDNTVPHALCLTYTLERWNIFDDDISHYWEYGLCGLQNMNDTSELNWEYVIDWTDDFSRVAHANGNNIFIAEESTYNDKTMTFTAEGRVTNVNWSNDEQSLLSISRDRHTNEAYIEVWNVESGNRTMLFTVTYNFISANLSPDDQTISITAGIDEDFTLSLVDVITGHVIFEKSLTANPSQNWKPDGSTLALKHTSTDSDFLSIIDISDGKTSVVDTVSAITKITGFDWHPTQDWLAISTGDDILIYDIESRNVIASVSSTSHIIGWSPDGTMLTTRNPSQIISIWEVNTSD